MPERPGTDYVGLVVLILTSAIGVSIIIGVTGLVIYGVHATPEGSDLLSTLAGAAMGVVGTFVGLRAKDQLRNGKPPPDD